MWGNALPETGGEHGVAVAGELLPLRIEGLELSRCHRRILRGIETAAKLECHIGQTREEREALVGLDWKVEGKRDARLREAHHPGRRNVAEGLENGEEAC